MKFLQRIDFSRTLHGPNTPTLFKENVLFTSYNTLRQEYKEKNKKVKFKSTSASD